MSRRSALLLSLGLVVVLGGGFALYYFAPWTAFTNKTVNDESPAIEPMVTTGAATPGSPSNSGPTYPRVLARGEIIAQGNYSAAGSVAIIETAPGERILRFENLNTDNGPDLKVWLTDQPVDKERNTVFDDGAYVDLGALKGNKGNQNYDIPASADLAALTSVSIWCDRFNTSFGAAQLNPA